MKIGFWHPPQTTGTNMFFPGIKCPGTGRAQVRIKEVKKIAGIPWNTYHKQQCIATTK